MFLHRMEIPLTWDFSEKCIPVHRAGIYGLILGEYGMGGNVTFFIKQFRHMIIKFNFTKCHNITKK